ncbi:hypothetical protein OIU78_008944 [Salix suchowensis]|nr:hypothetical protein OIU78_008944 [Salix suchowensis]
MESFTAEDLSTIGGIATVSLLHSFIPTHWLPFSIVGRAQKWTLSRTLLVTAFGAVLHVLSTSLLGITAITMANTIAGEETVHKLASLLLIILGGCYMILFLSGKGGHSHSHNQPYGENGRGGACPCSCIISLCHDTPCFSCCWEFILHDGACHHCAAIQVSLLCPFCYCLDFSL